MFQSSYPPLFPQRWGKGSITTREPNPLLWLPNSSDLHLRPLRQPHPVHYQHSDPYHLWNPPLMHSLVILVSLSLFSRPNMIQNWFPPCSYPLNSWAKISPVLLGPVVCLSTARKTPALEEPFSPISLFLHWTCCPCNPEDGNQSMKSIPFPPKPGIPQYLKGFPEYTKNLPKCTKRLQAGVPLLKSRTPPLTPHPPPSSWTWLT